MKVAGVVATPSSNNWTCPCFRAPRGRWRGDQPRCRAIGPILGDGRKWQKRPVERYQVARLESQHGREPIRQPGDGDRRTFARFDAPKTCRNRSVFIGRVHRIGLGGVDGHSNSRRRYRMAPFSSDAYASRRIRTVGRLPDRFNGDSMGRAPNPPATARLAATTTLITHYPPASLTECHSCLTYVCLTLAARYSVRRCWRGC